MTRSKLTYEFTPFPKKRHSLWKTLPHSALGLCVQLFELGEGGSVKFYGDDWMSWLCMELNINGKDRPNIRKTLRRMQELGLIGVRGGLVSFCFKSDDELLTSDKIAPATLPVVTKTSSADDAQVESQPCLGQHQPTTDHTAELDTQSLLPLDLSVGNDSGQKTQTEENRREETRTERNSQSAREPESDGIVVELKTPLAIGYSWLSDIWYAGGGAPDREAWRAEYEKIGKWSAVERATIARHMAATPYLKQKRSKATPGHIVKFREAFLEGPRLTETEFQRPSVAKTDSHLMPYHGRVLA